MAQYLQAGLGQLPARELNIFPGNTVAASAIIRDSRGVPVGGISFNFTSLSTGQVFGPFKTETDGGVAAILPDALEDTMMLVTAVSPGVSPKSQRIIALPVDESFPIDIFEDEWGWNESAIFTVTGTTLPPSTGEPKDVQPAPGTKRPADDEKGISTTEIALIAGGVAIGVFVLFNVLRK